MPSVDAPPTSFRMTQAEAEALRELAERWGLPRSAVIRAAVRALYANPDLFFDAPQPMVGERLAPPPPPPRKRRRRR